MTRSVLGILTGILLSLCFVSTVYSETNSNIYVNGGYVFGEEFSYPRVSIGVSGQLVGFPDWLSFGVYGTGSQSGDIKKYGLSVQVTEFSGMFLNEETNLTKTTENGMGYGVELILKPLSHTYSNGLTTCLVLTPFLGSTEVEIEDKQVFHGVEETPPNPSDSLRDFRLLPPVTTSQKDTSWKTTYGGKISLQVSKVVNIGCLKTVGLELGGGYNKIDNQDGEGFGSSSLVLGF